MTEDALRLRATIMRSFADTGEPPELEPSAELTELVDAGIVVLDDAGGVLLAEPFAAPEHGTRIEADGRTWWATSAWGAFGVVAALKLSRADLHANDQTLTIRNGELCERMRLFHVAIPPSEWRQDPRRAHATMLPFVYEASVHEWAEQTGEPVGRILPIGLVERLGPRWHAGILDEDWRPRSKEESQDLLAKAGLYSDWWSLDEAPAPA